MSNILPESRSFDTLSQADAIAAEQLKALKKSQATRPTLPIAKVSVVRREVKP